MDKFFANLTGNKADEKNSKKKDASWQGGRSDMDRIKSNNGNSSNNRSNNNNKDNDNDTNGPKNLLTNANAALQKIDLFKSSKAPPTKGGQSLGGTKPGRLLPVSLPHAGPLGLEIEKRRDAAQSAIISSVVPHSQADVAGLLRGDVICRADGSDREFSYHEFLKLAQSGLRPLRFQVRRVESYSSSSLLQHGSGSVDALHRKQAVIAAAEAREAKNRALWSKSSSREAKPPPSRTDAIANSHHPSSESPLCDNAETLRAIEAIKAAEKTDAETLGYNPYEARAIASGQARNATVVMTRGEMNAENAPAKLRGEGAGAAAPGVVAAPRDPTAVVVPSEFESAFSVLVTSCPDGDAVRKSLATMRKLIHNAVTKGQCGLSNDKEDKDEETASKFRRVRLSNPKIKETVTDMHGALELMMAVGFVLSENEADGETYLVLPPGEEVAEWIGVALRQMEEYELGG